MPALLFVYNADGGLFNTVADIAHKIFSPSTYPCHLCALTHSPIGMRSAWKKFLAELGVPLEFMHRDEFRRQFGMRATTLPAILRRTADGGVQPWLDAEQINAAASLDELIDVIRHKLASA